MNKKKTLGIKKVASILLFSVLLSNTLISQDFNRKELLPVNDLKEQFNLTSTDSARARMATEISTAYRLILEIDSCKKYASLANGFLENITGENEYASSTHQKIRAKAIENYGTVLAYENAKKAVDTLQYSLKLWQATGDKKGMAKAYYSLGRAYSFSSNQIEALNYFEESLSLYEELENKAGQADVLYEISLEKRYLGKYGDALEFSLKSLKVAEEIHDTLQITNALLGNSFNYLLAKNYPEALKEQEKALRLFQIAKDSIGIARTYNDMGVTYLFAKNFVDALKYHKKALEFRKKVDASSMGSSYNYIAEIYRDMGELDEALKTIMEGLSYSLRMGDNRFILNSYEEAGNIYVELKDYEQAIANYNKGFEIAEKNDNKRYQALLLAKIGHAQQKAGNLNKALSFLKKAEADIPKTDYNIRKFIYETMTKTYEEDNDFKNAFRYQAKFYQVKDSLEAIKKDEKITTLTQELIYESKNALQKANQEKQIALKETQIQKEKFIRNLSIGGLIFILVLAILIFIRFKEKRKLSLSLEKSLFELKETQAQLIQQEKLASLGQLTAGIAHEIKNPLNFVNNFSEVSVELIDEALEVLAAVKTRHALSPRHASALLHASAPDKESLEETIAILQDVKSNLTKVHEHGTRADSIVKSMLQHSRGGSGKPEPTDLNALIKEYVNLSFHGMRAGKNPINVDIQLDLDEKIGHVNLIGEDFSRVLLNIFNNAFDAMREKAKTATDYLPILSVKTELTANGQPLIAVSDNGPGIPDDLKDKILQPFFTTKKGNEGTGLGLSITNDIVKAHGGELTVKTKSSQGLPAGQAGTTFTITLPT